MKRLFYTLLIIGSLSLSMMVTSCKESTVYYKYAHTPIAGWEKNDTLSFTIPPLTSTGLYQENLGLRITGAYPFMGITLIVEQEIFPNQESKKEKEERNKLQIMGVKSHQAKKVAHGEKIVKLDTIQCNLINKDGVKIVRDGTVIRRTNTETRKTEFLFIPRIITSEQKTV